MAERTRAPGPQLIVASDDGELAAALAASAVPTGQPVVILIGGAAKLADDESGRLASMVRDGVIATASETGATVIDGGTDAGVMAIAGQARHELKANLPLVGVAPAGRVKAAGVVSATGETPLEPNHSHVILAPGDEWGSELAWMLEAARLLSAGKPVVAVLVDGGPLALTEATKSLAQGWPLITIAGTGRAADDLAAYAGGSVNAALGGAGKSAIHVVNLDDGPPRLAALLKRLLMAKPGRAGPTPPPRVKIEYPALYIAASEASKRGQRLHKLIALAELSLTVAGLAIAAVIGLAVLLEVLPGEPTFPPGIPAPPFMPPGTESFVALALAGTFLAAFVLRFVGHSASYDDDWFTGRAVAESAKSDAWRYMMRVPPYDEASADREFARELAGLVRRASDIRQAIDRLPARPQQISATMRQVRGLSLFERRDVYVAQRLLDQAEWYGRRGALHRRRASQWFWAGVLMQLLAAGLALFALYDAGHTPLLLRFMSLFASTAIFFTAWSQLNRDDELAKSYAAALQELVLIADTVEDVTSEEALATMVDRGEEALGRENRVWVAKRAERYESPEFGHAD